MSPPQRPLGRKAFDQRAYVSLYFRIDAYSMEPLDARVCSFTFFLVQCCAALGREVQYHDTRCWPFLNCRSEIHGSDEMPAAAPIQVPRKSRYLYATFNLISLRGFVVGTFTLCGTQPASNISRFRYVRPVRAHLRTSTV